MVDDLPRHPPADVVIRTVERLVAASAARRRLINRIRIRFHSQEVRIQPQSAGRIAMDVSIVAQVRGMRHRSAGANRRCHQCGFGKLLIGGAFIAGGVSVDLDAIGALGG